MTLRIVLLHAWLAAGTAYGQKIMGGPRDRIVLRAQDQAVLDGHEHRTDLSCTVSSIHPELGFDLSLHTGYDVSVPMGELAGKGNMLTAIFRVTPVGKKDNRTYFYQKWPVPDLAQDVKGTAHLKGWFVVGEGKYQVDWLMRDQDERSCSARWQIAAIPQGKDKRFELRISPGMATEAPQPFRHEAPVKRGPGAGLSVVVMLHVASQSPGATGLKTEEIPPVMYILRKIAQEPRIDSYSVTAFNLERRQVLFRREREPEVDFPALGEAIERDRISTIDVKRLRQYDSEPRFLGALLAEEMGQNHPDAVIFVGPKTNAEFATRGALKELSGPGCPVFYLTYIADPASNPWRDLIGSAVKLWKGLEYTITRPRDIVTAWNEVMSRMPTQDGMSGNADRRQPESRPDGQKITSASDVKHR